MRLADEIDDYCSRCRRTTNHNVVSLRGEEADKVRCRTCTYEHSYRKNRGGRKEMTAQEAFQRLMASVTGSQPEPPPAKGKGRRK